MILLSVTGLFRTILIIIGIMVLLRVIGKMMIAKRNLDEEKDLLRKQRESEKMVSESKQNFGKTTISKIDKRIADEGGYVDFEEVK